MGKTTFQKTGLQLAFGILFLLPLLNQAQSISVSKNVSKTTQTAEDYCTAGAENIDFEHIGGFEIGSFKSPIGTSTGYTNRTNLTIDLIKGEEYLIAITPAWGAVTGFSAGYAIWIDYNGDKIFNYADEMIWSGFDGAHTVPMLGTFRVSSTATTGTTRLRVAMQFAYIPTACGAFKYGEVEDYTVNLIEGSASDPLAPTPPTNITASDITETQINLSWTAPVNANVTGYDIYKNQILVASSTTPSYRVSGLQPNTSYLFTVKAKNANGNISASSAPLQTKTIPDITPPTIPVNFDIASLMSRKVNLSWDPVTDLVSGNNITYKIYSGNTLVATTKSTNYLITDLKPGTEYLYKLYAYDEANNFSNSVNTIKLTTPIDTTPPTQPIDLTAADITTSSVTLSWTASTDNEEIDSYYISGGPNGLWSKDTKAIISNLKDGTTYTFTVTAVDLAGLYSESATITITTTALPKYCVSNSTNILKKNIELVSIGTLYSNTGRSEGGYSDLTSKSVKLTKGIKADISISAWIDPAQNTSNPINRYYVWIDYNGDKDFDDENELVVKGSTSSKSFNGFITVPNTAITGKTRMRVTLKEGTAPTPCETFTYGEVEDYTVEIAPGTLGVDEHETSKTEMVTLNPNPAHDNLFVNNIDNIIMSFRIINLTGQVIIEGKTKNSIDINKLSAGVYIIELSNGEKSVTKKFIKN